MARRALARAARPTAFEALEEAKQGGIDNPLDAQLVLADPYGELAPARPN